MNASYPFRAAERLSWTKTEDFRGIRAQPDQTGLQIPVEGDHTAGPERFFKPSFPLEDCVIVQPSLTEQGCKHQRAERSGHNGRLGRQDTFLDRKVRVTEKTDREYGRPHDR